MNLQLRSAPRPERRSGVFSPDKARVALACIRLVNGAGATLVPVQMSKRLGVDATKTPEVLYPLRMFGIRTLLLGGDLLLRRGRGLELSLRVSPYVHAGDAASAAFAGYSGHLPRKAAATGTTISLVNLLLALRARKSYRVDQDVASDDA